LSEFFPRSANLQGLNVNKGREIKIRLRPASNASEFLSEHHALKVMLHELSHIVHSEPGGGGGEGERGACAPLTRP
jgi:hypothetical protein